ncbi:hypothetical protein Cob_v001882 [Colletotrichum orbiculare MAFF 240422]|uniref:Uncharacterized protein n=1 Tax=Colletotrichum orbiculare (strain 104-T / ATCC 96160 / CBS 514.97 / LARS 414 / MAFF 240422) TaxID=1213857 RepID=A0A484G417_COLOR|nr:hypothetical protein Cob_v001882 [Colletotrichum orbiculare MAFF 240422]
MSFLRNAVPLVVAVGAGVSISVYTLKPSLEEQQKLRESQAFKDIPSGEPKTPAPPVANPTIAQLGTKSIEATPKS